MGFAWLNWCILLNVHQFSAGCMCLDTAMDIHILASMCMVRTVDVTPLTVAELVQFVSLAGNKAGRVSQ